MSDAEDAISLTTSCEEEKVPAGPQPDRFLGRHVRLHGLSLTELNGKLGTATSFDAEAGRMVVELDDGQPVKVRLKNMQLAGGRDERSPLLGQRVRLHGLSTTSLNGLHGVAVSFDREAGRFVVELADEDRHVKVKASNLRLAKPSRGSSCARVDAEARV